VKAKHARTIRFGILSCRFDHEEHRLNFYQRLFLVECDADGMRSTDKPATDAYFREWMQCDGARA